MESDTSVLVWWGGMSCIALLNLTLLAFSFKNLREKIGSFTADLSKIRRWQFGLSAVYVLGCGFRSVLPRGDLRRIVLVDHWISSVAIGRSVATLAELAFAAQFAWLLWEIGKNANDRRIQTLAKLLVPQLFLAEIFSWYACTTRNYFGTVIEESLWALAAVIVVISFLLVRQQYSGPQKRFLTLGILGGAAYFLYMVFVDIRTYVSNWLRDEAAGKAYVSVSEGLREVATVWYPTGAHADWRYEFVWMTLYFSVAVWMSLYLAHAPRMDKNLGKT